MARKPVAKKANAKKASAKKASAKKASAKKGPKPLVWNSSTHSISDIRDWAANQLLEIQPDFQRREVWSEVAKVSLIDTILRNIPIPKLYLQAEVRQQKTFRSVIDGQQRMTSILDFLADKLVLSSECPQGFQGRKYSELTAAQKKRILYYKIDVNEVIGATEEQVRELYSRVNKYTKQLTKQELRRADYPGDFLETSERCATLPYFEEAQVFSAADVRRMGDVEFVSELLATLLAGVQDKKSNLDDFYAKYAKWPKQLLKDITARFTRVIEDLGAIFAEPFELRNVRFKQKADYYSLFMAIDQLQSLGHTLPTDVTHLRSDLAVLDEWIAPQSPISLLSAYAVRCVSDANSAASRRWRAEVLTAFIGGSYRRTAPVGTELLFVTAVHADLSNGEPGANAPRDATCPLCNKVIRGFSFDDCTVSWPPMSEVFHLSNLATVHLACATQAAAAGWKVPTPAKLTPPPVWLED